MSSNDERDLARALHGRSEEVGGHPIGLDAVRADARRIQRRRRVAGAAVAAAVFAVAVPVGLNLTGGTTRGSNPVGPAGQPSATTSETTSGSPSPTPSPSPTVTTPAGDGRVALTVAGLPTGPAPSVPWIQGRTLHHDGTTNELPGDYTDVSSYRGGWLAVGTGNDGSAITRIDSTGKVLGTTSGGSWIVASGDGTRIAWVEDWDLHAGLPSGMSDSENVQKVTPGVYAEVVGWANGDLVYTLSGGDGSSVWISDLDGHTREVPGITTAWGSNDEAGLIAGQVSYDNRTGTSCWAVTTTSGERLWRQCDWALHGFSPAGRYVVGTPSGCDGIGCSEVALLEARTGKVAARFTSPRDPLTISATQAWEDEEHLLTTAWDGSDWWILRLGVDGSIEKAAGPVKGPDYEAPFHLTTTR